jgi:hypothetical protein
MADGERGDESLPDAGAVGRQLHVDRHRPCGIRVEARVGGGGAGPGGQGASQAASWHAGCTPPAPDRSRRRPGPGLPRPAHADVSWVATYSAGYAGPAGSGGVRRWLGPYTAAALRRQR